MSLIELLIQKAPWSMTPLNMVYALPNIADHMGWEVYKAVSAKNCAVELWMYNYDPH